MLLLCFPHSTLLTRVSSAGVLREVTTHFIVDARAHYKSGGSHIKACVVNPSGANTDTYITDKGDGSYRVEYTPYEDGEDLHFMFSEAAEWFAVRNDGRRIRSRWLCEGKISITVELLKEEFRQ